MALGFIDTHFQPVGPFATKMAVADGITTGMGLSAVLFRPATATPKLKKPDEKSRFRRRSSE